MDSPRRTPHPQSAVLPPPGRPRVPRRPPSPTNPARPGAPSAPPLAASFSALRQEPPIPSAPPEEVRTLSDSFPKPLTPEKACAPTLKTVHSDFGSPKAPTRTISFPSPKARSASPASLGRLRLCALPIRTCGERSGGSAREPGPVLVLPCRTFGRLTAPHMCGRILSSPEGRRVTQSTLIFFAFSCRKFQANAEIRDPEPNRTQASDRTRALSAPPVNRGRVSACKQKTEGRSAKAAFGLHLAVGSTSVELRLESTETERLAPSVSWISGRMSTACGPAPGVRHGIPPLRLA
jgi:hypothetical protein